MKSPHFVCSLAALAGESVREMERSYSLLDCPNHVDDFNGAIVNHSTLTSTVFSIVCVK